MNNSLLLTTLRRLARKPSKLIKVALLALFVVLCVVLYFKTDSDIIVVLPLKANAVISWRPRPGVLPTQVPPKKPAHASPPTVQSWKAPLNATSLTEYFDRVDRTPSGLTWGFDALLFSDDLPAIHQPSSNYSKPFDGIIFRVEYPRNSINPHGAIQGGLGCVPRPLNDFSDASRVTLRYSVYFPPSFDFKRGGKLPGLYGMIPGSESPTGGAAAESGWSARFMWRSDGKGELYLYLPAEQSPKLLQVPPRSNSNGKYGRSIGVGSFVFERGQWTHISLEIEMNTPNQLDGMFKLHVNGVPTLSFHQVMFRTTEEYSFDSILFETFFGGHSQNFASPRRQFAYFGNFQLEAIT